MTTAIFYKYWPDEGWRYAGSGVERWDQASFAAENPRGEVLMIDLDAFSERMAASPQVDVVSVKMVDGRIVDVFPETGGVQVYTPDKKQGYELTLPDVELAHLAAKLNGTPGSVPVDLRLLG